MANQPVDHHTGIQMVSTLFLGFCADKDFCIRDNKTRPKKCHYNIIHTGSFKTNLTTRSKGKKRVPSSCVLPGHETCRVKSKNVLSVIILASRKWASPPLPVPGGVGGGQVQSLCSAQTTDV